MRSLRDLEPGQQLECLSSRFSQEAEVLLNGEVVGTLTWKPEGFESLDGSWTITTRKTFLTVTQVVAERAGNVEVARCEGSLLGDPRFVFPGGRSYVFTKTGSWPMRYALLKNDIPVLAFTMPKSWIWLEMRIVATVEPGGRSAEHDLPMLVFLGCHLTLDAIVAAMG